MEELQDKYGVWPPIITKSMTFSYDSKKESFLSKYDLFIMEKDENGKEMKRTELTAKEAFEALREKYSIDKNSRTSRQERYLSCVRK